MRYIALHYIALSSGQMVTPGEIFEAEFDEETLRRLTSRQAIRPCQSLNITPSAPAEEEDAEAPEEQAEGEPDEEENEREDDSDAAPEIDAADGIAPSAPAQANKAPKKTGTRRKTK
ncbi:MAG: hypothetical protein BHW29_09160 [Faecalibacterium sp. CAG:74_58_120]|nr:MAG: hypothetical protein BHW29_09160 [Faecalibacterium sp. CAG:74_58_120]